MPKQLKYTDGTFSRELENDWETTGKEDMSHLHALCTQKASILHVKEKLDNILELLTICREALSESELIDIKEIVVNVLYFHVEEQIKIAGEELGKI